MSHLPTLQVSCRPELGRCLVHVSAHSNEFTRKQIRGRIRGGEEYYVVFRDTNDEKKLLMNVPEPEGPLHHVEVELSRLPVTKVDRSTYRVSFEQATKAPYLTLPITVLKQLRGDSPAAALKAWRGSSGPPLRAVGQEGLQAVIQPDTQEQNRGLEK